MGYDDENNRDGMHPLRKVARFAASQKMGKSWQNKFQKYLKGKHQYQLLAWLLLSKNGTAEEISNICGQDNVGDLKNFEELFQKFILEKDNIIPWEKINHYYQVEKQEYYKIFADSLTKLITSLNLDREYLGLTKIILIPNFLDAHNRGVWHKSR